MKNICVYKRKNGIFEQQTKIKSIKKFLAFKNAQYTYEHTMVNTCKKKTKSEFAIPIILKNIRVLVRISWPPVLLFY